MRRNELLHAVAELLVSTFGDDDADVAEAIVEDDAFPALASRLQYATAGDYDAMDRMITTVVNDLDDNTLDWLVDEAANPAAFIASKL